MELLNPGEGIVVLSSSGRDEVALPSLGVVIFTVLNSDEFVIVVYVSG